MAGTGSVDEAARRYLLRQISEHARLGLERLPTVRQLAAGARVGAVTMSRVVHALAEQGQIDARAGRGIWLPRQWEEPVETVSRLMRWQDAARGIAEAILNGRFGPGEPLPTAKELMDRFGASHPTLRRALRSLAARGIVVRNHRGYRVAVSSAPQAASAVGLVAPGVSPHDFVAPFPLLAEVLRTTEEQAARANVRLLLFDFERRRFEGTPLGVILLAVGMGGLDFGAAYSAVAALDMPVTVLAEGLEALLPTSSRRVQVIRFASSRQDGAGVGRFLLQQGHRHIAYISPVHGADWSQERLAGLRSVYGALASSASVTAVTCDTLSDVSDLYEPGSTPADLVERAAKALRTVQRGALRPVAGMLEEMGATAPFAMEAQVLHDTETQLFRRALGIRDVTAWVTTSDNTASRALVYLRHRKVAVPSRLSLVGFDDSAVAFAHRISSYNFNIPAVVQAMFRHVLGPRTGRTGADWKPLTIEGFVTQRATTSRRDTTGAHIG